MAHQERAGTISDLIDIIIGAGPNIGDALEHTVLAVGHFKEGVAELQLAAVAITGRQARDEGEDLTGTELAKVAELEAAAPATERRGLLSDLFAFIKANPELLQFLLLFLKK